MTGTTVQSTSASARDEDAVRQRWHDRDVEARIVAPEDGSAPTYVIHGGPPTAAASAGTRAIALRATVDVVARHRAMCGATAVRVVGHAGAPDRAVAAQSLALRLGCVPGDEVYRTTDAPYVDSVWWALGQLWDAGLLREAHAVASWCPRCAAPVDDDRVDDVERSATTAFVRFPVTGDNALRRTGASLLVEVTAPWTLPAVTAVRLDPGTAYVLAQAPGDDYPLVLARSAVIPLLGDGATIHRDVAVDELLGLAYRPVAGSADHPAGRDVVVEVAGSAVARTGFAPVAPGCGSEDLQIAANHDIAVVDPFGHDGRLAAVDGDSRQDDLAQIERKTIARLHTRGLVVRSHERTRRVRACRACGGAAVDRARPTWLIATDRLPGPPTPVLDGERRPAGDVGGCGWRAVGHVDGADGAPLPLWRCERCGHVTAVDSRAALSTLAGRALDGDQPHAALADGLTVRCQRCGHVAARWVGQTVDPLVVAAAAPFARFGFPALPGSDTDVAHRCHADLVVDGSVRPGRWADALRTMSLLVWNAEGFEATLRVGAPRARTRETAPTPDAASHIGRYGADAVRWAVLAEPAHADGGGPAAAARFLRRLRAACDEHVAAAEADGWQPFDAATSADIDARTVMDRWVLAELSDAVAVVRACLDGLDPRGGGRRIRAFVDDLSDWYLPRTRARRDTAGELSRECRAPTHATLHECLVTVAALLAPFAPFTSDELYERLVRSRDPAAPDSVHLLRYPTVDPTARNDGLRDAMATARRIVATGQRGRRRAGIDPDRWVPLATVAAPAHVHPYWTMLRPLITDALRVSAIEHVAPGSAGADRELSGRWHVTRDADTAVAVALSDPAPEDGRLSRDLVVNGSGTR